MYSDLMSAALLYLKKTSINSLYKATNPSLLTYLMEKLRELHLHLFSLEHVVLSLLTDWRNLIELSCHRVRFLKGNMRLKIRLRFKDALQCNRIQCKTRSEINQNLCVEENLLRLCWK